MAGEREPITAWAVLTYEGVINPEWIYGQEDHGRASDAAQRMGYELIPVEIRPLPLSKEDGK